LIFNKYSWHPENHTNTASVSTFKREERMSQNSSSEVEKRNPPWKKSSPCFLIGGFILVIALLAVCGLVALLAVGFTQVDQSPKIIEVSEVPDSPVDEFIPSEEQTALAREIGSPQSFAILFYSIKDTDGNKIDVRDETWTYYDQNKMFQFINGKLTNETSLPTRVQNAMPIPYKPGQFIAYMSLDQVLSAARQQKYLEIPLEKELVPDSRLYYAEMLTFSLQNGKLRYIETLAMEKGVQP
jgi:hypothetical protein